MKHDSVEIWKSVAGYDGLYEVSSCGNIRSQHTRYAGKMLSPNKNKQGYLWVKLVDKNGLRKCHRIHRLVCRTFIGDDKRDVNHIDGNVSNNKLSNLEYVSRRENKNHSYKDKKKLTGAFKHKVGPWFSRIYRNGKPIYLGTFPTEHAAHAAYVSALNSLKEGTKYVRSE